MIAEEFNKLYHSLMLSDRFKMRSFNFDKKVIHSFP